MELNAAIKSTLDSAWHRDSAHASIQRWLEVCEKEGWGNIPEKISLLVNLFGASWYFTRLVFYRGRTAASLIDQADPDKLTRSAMANCLKVALEQDDMEYQLEQLRILKNETMLNILICYLDNQFNQQQTEQALTELAELSLGMVMEISGLRSDSSGYQLAVLGMGRMAGAEMTFGSDLDLIFLFDHQSTGDVTKLSRTIQRLLRNLTSLAPFGTFYEVDMRLRPHGTAGSLITSTNAFLEHHQHRREIWERQMMTRCRPVIDNADIGRSSLKKIMSYIYADYDHDYLQQEITNMRRLVQKEKGSPRDKFDVKCGRGGIMDIDFLTHYFQLCYGHEQESLQTCSTRAALEQLKQLEILDADHADTLLAAYDFLKGIETRLRLFDMKAISAFPQEPAAHIPLARAMGYFDKDEPHFVEKYLSVSDKVRTLFNHYLKGID